MKVLRRGMSGAAVSGLQQALLDKGFDPGLIDGAFGGGTEAAVLAFQKSEGLLADGVAGPRTLNALQLVASPALPDATGAVTVEMVSQMFPFTAIGNIKAQLPFVLAALKERGLHDRPMVLMALATIRAEAEPFLPVDEGRSKFNTSPNGHPFDLYDSRRDLGNRGRPDGDRYKGRGFVQLTGRDNYRRYGPKLMTPAQSRDPAAARVVVGGRRRPAGALPRRSRAADQGCADARQPDGGASSGQRRQPRPGAVQRRLPARRRDPAARAVASARRRAARLSSGSPAARRRRRRSRRR